jgi:arylsulfatase A-like enzyme
MEPHFRYEPPEEFRDGFVPPGVRPEELESALGMSAVALFEHNARLRSFSPSTLKLLSGLYDGEIAALDHEVGALIESLARAGRLGNTVVVITSDHGESFGEHGFVDHMFGAHRTLRHVPLVVRYPPRFAPGDRVKDVVRLEDIAPTLFEVCGLRTPPGLDGKSLLADLPGRFSRGLVDAPHGLLDRWQREYPGPLDVRPLRADVRAVFDGRFHLLSFSDGGMELYDVIANPSESQDIAASRRDVVDRLRKLLPPW